MSEPHWIEANLAQITNLPLIAGPDPRCMVLGCGRSAFTHRLCKAHYKQARRRFDPSWIPPTSRNTTGARRDPKAVTGGGN